MDSAPLRVRFIPGYKTTVGARFLHIISGLRGTALAMPTTAQRRNAGRASTSDHLCNLPCGPGGTEYGASRGAELHHLLKRVIYVE